MNDSFIIFAHPRSGSNSLSFALSQLPGIKILTEPFNSNPSHNSHLNDQLKKVKSLKALDDYLDSIYENHNGTKHLLTQLPPKHNRHILSKKGYKIIFLYRQNILKSMISRKLAEKSHIWFCVNEKGVKKYKNRIKEIKRFPINIKKLHKEVRELNKAIKDYRSFLIVNNIPFFEITYEELYGSKTGATKKLEKVNEIIDFLGFEKIKSFNDNPKIKNFLACKNKMNDRESYNLISNANEIEEKLGNDETGHLFENNSPQVENINSLKSKLKKLKSKVINA